MSLKDTLQKAAEALGLIADDSDESEEVRKKRHAQADSGSTSFTGQSFSDSSVGASSDATPLPDSAGHHAAHSTDASTSLSHVAGGNTPADGSNNSATDSGDFSGAHVEGNIASDIGNGNADNSASDTATASVFDGASADASVSEGDSAGGDSGTSAGDGGASGGDGGGGSSGGDGGGGSSGGDGGG